jgi:hypothetical protein
MAEEKEQELPLSAPDDEKLFGNDPPPLKPVDINLDDETPPQEVAEGGQVETPEVPPEEPKKSKNRVPATQRIGQLRGEISARDQQIAALQQQLNEMQGQANALSRQAQESDIARFDQHDVNWHQEENDATAALEAAYEKQARGEAGAATDIAKATRRLAKASSEVQAIDAFKANHPDGFNADGTRRAAQPQQRVEQPRQQTQQQAQPQMELPQDVYDWIDNNPWINKDNPEFDPEMAHAATELTNRLDGKFRRSGRGEEIGTKTYFDELDGLLADKFPEAYEDAPAPVAPPQAKRNPAMTRPNGAGVAPASRQAQATPAPGNPGSGSVRLSADEQDMAMRMGYRYEYDHPKAGQRMSNQDALRHHAKHKNGVAVKRSALGLEP